VRIINICQAVARARLRSRLGEKFVARMSRKTIRDLHVGTDVDGCRNIASAARRQTDHPTRDICAFRPTAVRYHTGNKVLTRRLHALPTYQAGLGWPARQTPVCTNRTLTVFYNRIIQPVCIPISAVGYTMLMCALSLPSGRHLICDMGEHNIFH